MTINPNALEVEVPAPGTIFEEHYIDPRNLELINDEDKARKLTKQELKKLRAKQREFQSHLEANNYFDLKSERAQLRERHSQLLVEYQTYPTMETKQAILEVRNRGRVIKKLLEPLKKYASHLIRIEMRLTEHESALAYERVAKRDRDQMRHEVAHFWHVIRQRYSQLKFREDIHVKNKHVRIFVKCEECYFTEDEIIYKLDVSRRTLFGSSIPRLPEGVRVRDLTKQETLDELSASCERPVWSPHNDGLNFDNGAWIVVSRLAMRGGLPEYIELNQVLAKYRQDDRNRFPLPLGIKRGRKINWVYMDQHPHFMINGQTFSGKSNAIVASCATLVQMHTPDEIKLILVDLKRGGDLKPFENTPHALMPVINETQKLEKVLAQLQALMYERMEVISKHTVDIQKYNAMMDSDNQMSRILVVIDEYTGISTDPVSAINVKQFTTILATQARASGIHLLIGNQQPYSKDVPSGVKGNITFHLTGRQITMGASISTVGNASATKIKKIAGRMVCNDGLDIFDVQIPYATPDDVKQAVSIAQNYPAPKDFKLPELSDGQVWDLLEVVKPKELTEHRIIELSLNELEGNLKAIRLWELLSSEGVSNNQVRKMVKRIASKGEIQHGETSYTIEKQPGNFYKLIPVENSPQIDSYAV